MDLEKTVNATEVQENEQPEEKADKLPPKPEVITRGKILLKKPIPNGETELTEIAYDFNKVSGKRYLEILDSKTQGEAMMTGDRLTHKVALKLFAAAAEAPQMPNMEEMLEQMSLIDLSAAVTVAKTFFIVTAREAQMSIANS